MKKGAVIFSVFAVSIILSAFMVSAQGLSEPIQKIGEIITSLYDGAIMPLAKFLIGTQNAQGEGAAQTFFSMILLLVLLVSLIWVISERIPLLKDSGWLQFIISFGISLIAIRFISTSPEWFKMILLPNQVLGIALLSLLPLVIFFFFVEDIGQGKPTLRKIMWMLAGVIFLVLYLLRWEELKSGGFNPSTVYLIAFVLCFFLLLFDGTITKAWNKGKAEANMAGAHKRLSYRLLEDMKRIDELYSSGSIDKAEYEAERKNIEQRYANLRA